MYHNKRVIDTAYAVLTSDVMLASYRDFFADWVYEQTDPVGFLTSQLPACEWLTAPELPKEDPSPMDTSISMELFMAAFQREARWREQFDAMMAQAMKYTAYIVRKALGLDDDKLFEGVENYIANSGLDIAKDKASAYVAQWLAKEFPPILRVSEVIVQCSDAAVKNHENRSIVEEKLRDILNLLKQDCNAAFLRTICAKTTTKTIDARDAALLVFFNRATPSLLNTTTKSQTSILRSELFDAEKELHENYPFTDLCWNFPCAAFKDLVKQAHNQLGQPNKGFDYDIDGEAIIKRVSRSLNSTPLLAKMTSLAIDTVYFEVDDKIGSKRLVKTKTGRGLTEGADVISENTKFSKFKSYYTNHFEPFTMYEDSLPTKKYPITIQEQLEENVKTTVWETLIALANLEMQKQQIEVTDETTRSFIELFGLESLFTPVVEIVQKKVDETLDGLMLKDIYALASDDAKNYQDEAEEDEETDADEDE